MAVFQNLRKGSEAMKKAAKSGGKRGGFVPTLRWREDEEKHYVLFLQSIDDIPTVLFHKMMDCGVNENGKTIWRDFISRRDPNIDGSDGYDPLDDRGYKPTNRNIAIVCEMEPVFEGKKIVSFVPMMREFDRKIEDSEERETVTEPATYLVVESPSTFFSPLVAYSDEVGPIEDQVMLIRRDGKDQNTSYNPIAMIGKDFVVPEADDAIARLEAYVEELASEERMRELVDSLPEDHVFNKYAKMNAKSKGKTSSEPKATSTAAPRQSAAKKSTTEAKPKKRTRFDELMAEVEGHK